MLSSLKNIEYHNIRTFGVKFFLFMSPLSVCGIYFPNSESVILPICIGLLFWGHSFKHITSNTFLKNVSVLFYLPQVISTLWAILMFFFIKDIEYFDYLSGNLISRLFHQLFFFIIIWGSINTCLYSYTDYTKFLYSYIYGILIILGIMGLWQILHQFTGIWCPDLETRGHLYFARNLGFGRVTSLANEPSYLAPFIIDAILICLYLRKNILSIAFGIILICSLSFGGFLESVVLTLVAVLYMNFQTKVKLITFIIGVVILLFFFFPDLSLIVSTLLESRKELQPGFNATDTSRTSMILIPINYFLNGEAGSIIWGCGPSSFNYLFNRHDDVIYVTSNNIFVDLLYEGGIFGVTCLIILFGWLWSLFKTRGVNLYVTLIPKLFIIHIILSSMYRADYSAARFCAIFIVLYSFYLLNKNQHEIFDDNHSPIGSLINGK